MPPRIGQPRASRHEGPLGRGVEDVAQPLHGKARLMEVLPHLRQTQDQPHPAGQILKATSSPTDRLPSITSLAPK